MRRFASAALLTIASLALSGCGQAGGGTASREQVRAVGSSTVFPFAKIIAEMLARSDASVSSPIVESTGTGSGINLFCAGLGANTPDIVNASRRMDARGIRYLRTQRRRSDHRNPGGAGWHRPRLGQGWHPDEPVPRIGLPGFGGQSLRKAANGEQVVRSRSFAAERTHPGVRPALHLGHARCAERTDPDTWLRDRPANGIAEGNR